MEVGTLANNNMTVAIIQDAAIVYLYIAIEETVGERGQLRRPRAFSFTSTLIFNKVTKSRYSYYEFN